MAQAQPNVAVVPAPGMGHLIPMVELATRLVHQHGFGVTFIVPNAGSPMQSEKQLLQSLPKPMMNSIFLPPVRFDDLPDHVDVTTRTALSLTRSLHHLRDSLTELTISTGVVAMVVDLFGSVAFDVAKELGIPAYIFYPTTAMALSFVFHLPKLDQTYSGEYKDFPEPLKLRGCVPIEASDFVDSMRDRKSDAYRILLHIGKGYSLAAGIMVNSFMDLEPGAFRGLMEDKTGVIPPVFPVGPLTQGGSTDGEHDCLRWLDQQPTGSVLFVCFGSGGTLSQDQLNELAMGLEMSGKRFLWVVKSPHDKASSATFFGSQNGGVDPLDFLPKGFLDRTKDVGLVVPSWAPQVQVLRHGAVGGFVTHCGWNSILEGIVNGVPLIAWPLYAEQRMNAVLVADDLKVALRVKENEKGLVGKEDIAKYVKAIFEGEEGKLRRGKLKELQVAGTRALTQDGSSTKSLAEVAKIWKQQYELNL